MTSLDAFHPDALYGDLTLSLRSSCLPGDELKNMRVVGNGGHKPSGMILNDVPPGTYYVVVTPVPGTRYRLTGTW